MSAHQSDAEHAGGAGRGLPGELPGARPVAEDDPRPYGYALKSVFLPWAATEGITEPDQVTRRVLDRFTSHLLEHGGKRGPLSRHSVASFAESVNWWLRWLRAEGELKAQAKAQVPSRPKQVLNVLSREEIQALEDAARTERPGAGDGGVGGDAQSVARTVVEPGQYLDVDARLAVGTGQPVVGEVGLPALVGEVCLEAGVGGLGALGGRRYDEAVAGQVAADGGGRDALMVGVSEVPGDALGARVETSRGQVAAQLEDQGDGLRGDRGR